MESIANVIQVIVNGSNARPPENSHLPDGKLNEPKPDLGYGLVFTPLEP